MSYDSDLTPFLGGLLPQQPKSTSPLAELLAQLSMPPLPTQPVPAPTTFPPSRPTVRISQRRILDSLAQASDGDVTDGRVLPTLDSIPIATGRKLKAAVLYSDLKGFSGLVAALPKRKTLAILHAFVSEMTRVASDFGGEVIDCAGDRILAVFWRPQGNNNRQPIYDAVYSGFWMQTVMSWAFGPVLNQKGLPAVACGIGIDYGDVIATRVGIRNRNKLVLLGEPANFAAKLEDTAVAGATVMSPIVYNNRPGSMTADNGWLFQAYPSSQAPRWYTSTQVFKDDSIGRYLAKK